MCGTASAYELGTHGRLTHEAYKRSVLSDSRFLSDLGIQNGRNPFGETYYDVSGSVIRERVRQQFEQQGMRMPGGVEPLSVEGWLMRGAIREDDLGQILGRNIGGDPHDDPYGNIFRVFNHFYDPALNRPLTTIAGVLGQEAPNWAVGSMDAFAQPNAPSIDRRNHFTVFDAREAMYRALTGRDNHGNVIAATELARRNYWATTFRALGDVVHLVQDMGQPQHTRNDAHSGVPGFGHKSVFEEYVEMRATGADSYNIDGTKVAPLPLTYNGYPIPAFTKYSDFWSTRNGANGRGLADYSNRGFFSAGTNLGSNVYSLPSNNAASYVKESTAGLLPKKPLQTINFMKGSVHDANLNTDANNVKLSTESLFDAFLFTHKTYNLNRFNYDDMAGQLIPRAVAYSAGLIDYFFRGKLEFKPDPNNAGKYLISNLGSEAMSGTFTLYYDAKDGKRYPVAGDAPNETWTNRTIAANGQLANLSFTTPADPAPKTPGVYMLVFNGDMGEEKAIPGVTVGAVSAAKITPPSRIAFIRQIGPYTGRENNDVFIINPDGSGERNVTNKPGSYDHITWSPDGTRIAFSSNRGGIDEIYALNVDSGELVNVSNTPGYDSHPTWSPDGGRIAFQTSVGNNSEIYVASADGRTSYNLTNTPADYEWAPVWSPNGNVVIFDSNYQGLYGLSLIDVQSGARGSLGFSPNGKKYDWNPRWSPDGKQIAFESTRDGNYEIYAVNADASSLVRLTNNVARDWFPRWSPYGTRIVFVSSSGNDKLHVVNADGSEQTLLGNTTDGLSGWNPAWSPDGERIVFQSNLGGIYVVNADGGSKEFLTSGTEPKWSPGPATAAVGASQ
jgi:Tol biopolymer transport system component